MILAVRDLIRHILQDAGFSWRGVIFGLLFCVAFCVAYVVGFGVGRWSRE